MDSSSKESELLGLICPIREGLRAQGTGFRVKTNRQDLSSPYALRLMPQTLRLAKPLNSAPRITGVFDAK